LNLSPGVVIAMAVALVLTLWIGFYPDPFINLARDAVGLTRPL
jgi:NADH:ubiquinone oxidoreductase subunit 4 (subunit M)